MSTEPPRSSGGLLDLVGRVLTFIDKPWKAITIVVLIVVLGFGAIIWQAKERLIDYFVPQYKVQQQLRGATHVEDLLRQLRRSTRVDLIMVWSVNLGSSTIKFVAGQTLDGKSWNPNSYDLPDELPALIDRSNAIDAIEVI